MESLVSALDELVCVTRIIEAGIGGGGSFH